MKTRVTVTLEESDEGFPQVPGSRQRRVSHTMVVVPDRGDFGLPSMDRLRQTLEVTATSTLEALEMERELHPIS